MPLRKTAAQAPEVEYGPNITQLMKMPVPILSVQARRPMTLLYPSEFKFI